MRICQPTANYCLLSRPHYDHGMSSHALTSSVDVIAAAASARARPTVAHDDAAPVVHVIGFWRRLVAAVIDGALLTPVVLGAWWIACKVAGVDLGTLQKVRIETLLDLVLQGSPALFATLGVTILVVLLYQLLFVSIVGQTPGLSLVGARVIDVYGRRPGLRRAVIRCLGWLVGLATLGLGLTWVAFDREKRGMHDWLAGTYVVRCASPRQESP